jgi:transcriptional regulator with XRE-family HTH domain
MTQPTPWTWLRRQRIKAGYTQTKLAAEADVSVAHICLVESGQRAFSPELTCRVARILNIDIDEMLDTAPTPPSQAVSKPEQVAS